MIENATTPSGDAGASGTGDVMNQLVPPSRRRSMRFLAWVAFAVVVVLGVWSVTSGTVVPRLEDSFVTHHGGAGPVHVGFETTNASRVDIEIMRGPAPRAGLELRGYSVGEPDDPGLLDRADVVAAPFPLRVPPGEAIALVAWYDVTDCAAISTLDGGDQQIDLRVRIADGPFSAFTTTKWVDAGLHPRDWTGEDIGEGEGADGGVAWASVVAQHVCAGSG